MATYIVHPGYGVTAPGEAESYIDAAELAALYGLDVADYEVGGDTEHGTYYDADHIHLLPRPDGRYLNIKTELGDNGTDVHYRTMVDPDKWRRDNKDHGVNRYRS